MYGTLKDGVLHIAPKKVIYEDNLIFNPPDSVYEALGYYPLDYVEMPDDAPSGFHYEESWEHCESLIVRTWSLVEDDMNIPDEEAFAIIMGEES